MHCLEISTDEQTLKSSRELSWCRREECAAAVREVSMRQVYSMVETASAIHNILQKMEMNDHNLRKHCFQPISLTNRGQPCNNQQYNGLHPTSFYSGLNLLRYCFDVSTLVLFFMGMMNDEARRMMTSITSITTPSGFAFCRHFLFV